MKLRYFFVRVLGVVLLPGLMSAGVAAQTTTATILGTVTDSSGAAAPDAMVKAVNTETGIIRTATSDAQGRFRVQELPIGTYDVTAEKAGFQSMERRGVVLAVGSQVVLDFAMPVGQLAQSIVVEGDVQQVETTSATISNLISPAQVRDLPLNGRNLDQLILLAPGVQTVTSTSHTSYYGNSDSFSVSGSRPNGQAVLLDNTDMQNFWNRGGGAGVLGSTMGVDAIAEFSTLTNTYGAQFGGSGAVVNSVSRSGTNTFHGSAYEFLRNDIFDASHYFDVVKQPFRKNQFGATLGGPIKQEKMFFFVNYEALRLRLAETLPLTVLDAQARTGLMPNSSGVYVPVGPGANNGIPAKMLPIINFYQQHIPLPTVLNLSKTGLPTGTGAASVAGKQIGSENYGLGRFDWSISDKDSLFARYLADQAVSLDPLAASAAPGWPYEGRNFNYFFTVEEKHIFSSTLINTARFAFSRPHQSAHTTASYAPFLILPGLPDTRLTVTGLSSPTLGGRQDNPIENTQNKFAYSDDILWSRGSHTLRIGGSVTRLQELGELSNPGGGSWSFSSVQNFLLGISSTYTGPIPFTTLADGSTIEGTNSRRYFRTNAYALYFQDDWKVFPTVTLNLGLRYDPTSKTSELNGNLTNVIPPPLWFPTAAPAKAFSRVPYTTEKNESLRNINPRIGIAWDPFSDHKTSVRAGFGVFHTILGLRDWAGGGYTVSPPFALVTAIGANFPDTTSGSVTQSQTLGWNYYNCCTPYVQQWNLSVQRQLPFSTLLTVGYVGSHGVHLVGYYDMNPQVPIADPNYNYGLKFASLLGNGKVSYNARMNPSFAAIAQMTTDATSNYHALQVGVNKRVSHNLQGQISYTYSECTDVQSGSTGIDTGTGFMNPFNRNNDKGWCAFNIRNSFTANATYLFPFRGNKLVEGWQISSIVSIRGGVPVYNLANGIPSAVSSGGGPVRPNYVPTAPGCNGNPVNENPKQSNGVFWINTNCFQLPRIGELGNAGRNLVIGPNYRSMDLSLQKMTRLTELLNIQFRAEFFNILNRPNFSLPSGNLFSAPQAYNTSLPNNGATISPTAGQITGTAGDPRQVQFGLKLTF